MIMSLSDKCVRIDFPLFLPDEVLKHLFVLVYPRFLSWRLSDSYVRRRMPRYWLLTVSRQQSPYHFLLLIVQMRSMLHAAWKTKD